MLDKLINQTWRTNLSIKTDTRGTVAFRGFFGEYEVIFTTSEGKPLQFKVHVSRNEENKWVFIIDGYNK